MPAAASRDFASGSVKGWVALRRCSRQASHAAARPSSSATAAWRTLRLSDMVLNHEVARVVLYEQLYRAHTVLRGEPYHH